MSDGRTGPAQRRPRTARDEAAAAELRRMKARATGLLVAIAALFVLVSVAGGDEGWLGYARAATEGSLVGGLADWFAVTALFRHPLGVPIPHTAVIRERKDQFGETLGAFVQENFLSPDVVGERVRASRVAERSAAWLSQPANAETIARDLAGALAGVADALPDDDVLRVLHEEVERAAASVPLAPLAARVVRLATAEGRHQELFDSVLNGASRFLDDNRENLRARFGHSAPWWLPGALEHRIFDRLLDGVRALLESVRADPDHELRVQFRVRLTDLADRLEHDPALVERGEKLKRDVLTHPELRRWTASLWKESKAALHGQATEPGSRLQRRLADAVAAAGGRLAADASLRDKVEELAESALRSFAEHHSSEISALITATVARWDPDDTSDKLELLLGRDLQFIRINGTVVGGLAGLAIHAAAQLLG